MLTKIPLHVYTSMQICLLNKDENVHKFALSAIRRDLLERERERERKERKREKREKREREKEREKREKGRDREKEIVLGY